MAERTGLALELDDRLMETAFGEWEGLTRDEIAAMRPDLAGNREWLFRTPGGETFEDVADRVNGLLADLPPEPDRRAILVSHGVTGRLLRGVYAGLPRSQILELDAPQDAVFRLMGGQVDRFDCAPLD